MKKSIRRDTPLYLAGAVTAVVAYASGFWTGQQSSVGARETMQMEVRCELPPEALAQALHVLRERQLEQAQEDVRTRNLHEEWLMREHGYVKLQREGPLREEQ